MPWNKEPFFLYNVRPFCKNMFSCKRKNSFLAYIKPRHPVVQIHTSLYSWSRQICCTHPPFPLWYQSQRAWLCACFLLCFCHKNCAFLILSNPATKGFVLKVTDDMYWAAAARVMYYKVHDLWAACGPADCVFHSKIRLIGVCTISTFISARSKA